MNPNPEDAAAAATETDSHKSDNGEHKHQAAAAAATHEKVPEGAAESAVSAGNGAIPAPVPGELSAESSAADLAALAVAFKEKKSKDEDSDDDEAEIVEESPCGRWLKRREEVKYRDVPGVDTAYLAMDSEEGVEVVWNEAQFSTSKKFKVQEDKLKNVFEALTLIDHPNIVRFHRYWTDAGSINEKTGEKKLPRLIFITEYMSSGSLKQFLRRTKKNNRKIQLQSWKRWCTQILSALSYLHQTCDPPILHGNLTCDTIFIQHNGLVKIGSIAPDIIYQNVKTCRDNIRNLHYLAPEWGDDHLAPGPPSDIFSFGMCALETAALDILTTANNQPEDNAATDEKSGGIINEETVQWTIDLLEDELQKDFIRKCLMTDPKDRPTARELLFHPVLFEVHSLKLLAAHRLVNTPGNINETMTDEAIQSHYGLDTIMATVKKAGTVTDYKLSNVPVAEKLEKFMEDVKFGIYPVTAFAMSHVQPKTRAVSPENQQDAEHPDLPDEKEEKESRRVAQMLASIGETEVEGTYNFIVIARLEDCMNRQLTTQITLEDTPDKLADELIGLNFICPLDRELVVGLFADVFRKLAVKSARVLSEQLEMSLTEAHLSEGGDAADKIKKEIGANSTFAKLQYYFTAELDEQTRSAARDPKLAAHMRDPTFVAKRFPMPEGSFFCPPALEDGSEPFKIPPAGTNAFDCSHLESAQVQQQFQWHIESSGNTSTASSTVAVSSVAAGRFTPQPQLSDKGPDPIYDPYAYLQGAQKVLEGLSMSQQQLNSEQEHEHQLKKEEERKEPHPT